jgi:hypothetical protein
MKLVRISAGAGVQGGSAMAVADGCDNDARRGEYGDVEYTKGFWLAGRGGAQQAVALRGGVIIRATFVHE